LKREESTTLTRNCNAIFQGRLPQKNKDPESFNSIGMLSIKEARCGLGEGINSIPSLLIRKIEGVQVKPLNVTLTLAYISIKNPLEVVEDAVVEADKTFITSETQKKVHWQKESLL